jgi:hypothetical protein
VVVAREGRAVAAVAAMGVVVMVGAAVMAAAV